MSRLLAGLSSAADLTAGHALPPQPLQYAIPSGRQPAGGHSTAAHLALSAAHHNPVPVPEVPWRRLCSEGRAEAGGCIPQLTSTQDDDPKVIWCRFAAGPDGGAGFGRRGSRSGAAGGPATQANGISTQATQSAPASQNTYGFSQVRSPDDISPIMRQAKGFLCAMLRPAYHSRSDWNLVLAAKDFSATRYHLQKVDSGLTTMQNQSQDGFSEFDAYGTQSAAYSSQLPRFEGLSSQGSLALGPGALRRWHLVVDALPSSVDAQCVYAEPCLGPPSTSCSAL